MDVQLNEVELLKAKLADLEKQLANKNNGGSGLKIAAKGGISMYGLGKFPVTLYASQWRKLISRTPEVEQFLKANAGKYAEKEQD
jgi:hypothetical protein